MNLTDEQKEQNIEAVAAFLNGEEIDCRAIPVVDSDNWCVSTHHRKAGFVFSEFCYRRKPFTLTRSINGFTLMPDQKWKTNGKERHEDFPAGFRPYLSDEIRTVGDEYRHEDEPSNKMRRLDVHIKGTTPKIEVWRTRRPLPLPDGWLPHDGGPCPVEKALHVRCFYDDGSGNTTDCLAEVVTWKRVVAYRVEPEMVPLGPEDVPPGSLFRQSHFKPGIFFTPSSVTFGEVNWVGNRGCGHYSFLQLRDWLIHRPGDLDAFDAPIWRRCEKPEGGTLPKLRAPL